MGKSLVRQPVNVTTRTPDPVHYDRITLCPETGINLDDVDIAKHAEALWPAKTADRDMSPEAKLRKGALMFEHNARSIERGMSRAD